jgi:8-oxo-dGTP pyrophosphatase MutT (NUDIX family)
LCAAELADRRDEVNDPIRPTCPRCGWIYYPANLNGALVVAELDDLVAVIFPPGAGGAALPGGIAEYGETPEECAIRETMEETGLAITDLAETCRFLHHGPFGPMLHFGFRARIVGGRLQDGDEGPARLVPVAQVTISEKREGSQRIFQAYLQA